VFILWGNIYDLQRNLRGEYVPLRRFLDEIFEQRDVIMHYSLSGGLHAAFLPTEKEKEKEEKFRSRYFVKHQKDGAGSSAVDALKGGAQKVGAETKTISELAGNSPLDVLKFCEKVLCDDSNGHFECALIIDFAHNVAPNQGGGQNIADRTNAELLECLARDERIKKNGHTVVLLTPTLAGLNEGLRSTQSGVVAIRVPKPDETMRTARWACLEAENGVEFAPGLSPEFLGRITNGLSLNQIDSIYRLAKEDQAVLTLGHIKQKKQEILQTEFGDRIRIKVPKWGFDHFGGKEELKRYMLEIRDYVLHGPLRRVPMGILASGPPGTGKTFFFECWAYECGFNFVELRNMRSKWVGESEEIAERIFAALDDLSPVIVVEDEADQSETSRDAPVGDTGVSNRLRQMKFMFTSDPKRRGKVIWVRISNRADLIDEAYKREGRSDDTIPFLMPEPEEYADIFRVMFKRYEIPTSVTDFSRFAELVKAKIYCTGASVEWMVLEADKYAGRQGRDKVEEEDLLRAIDDWEMKLNPREVDRQTIVAIEGSSKSLRPKNWEQMLAEAKQRFHGRCSSSNLTAAPGEKTPIEP